MSSICCANKATSKELPVNKAVSAKKNLDDRIGMRRFMFVINALSESEETNLFSVTNKASDTQ